MTPEQINEVWAVLDRERLASVARQGPEPIFATISGAHLYGFASPDSDVDLRGAFLLPARAVLGLYPPDETITIQDKSTVDLDWVAHDIRKFARMMTNHNSYVLDVFNEVIDDVQDFSSAVGLVAVLACPGSTLEVYTASKAGNI